MTQYGYRPTFIGMTRYTPKPGTGALFKNDQKRNDTSPDYKGSLTLADGSTVQIAGWVTQGANGKYLSLKASSVLPAKSEEADQDAYGRPV